LIKSFIQKPTEKKFFEILATPFIGYFGGRIAKEVIRGFLGSGEGISIPTVPTIPTPPNIPSLQQRYLTIYDSVSVSDEVNISFMNRYVTEQIIETPIQFVDNVLHSLVYNVLGISIIEAPIQFIDDVSHTLTYNILGVTIIETPIQFTDDVSIEVLDKEISISIIEPSITINDNVLVRIGDKPDFSTALNTSIDFPTPMTENILISTDIEVQRGT
jgi:hypothetical protein